MTSNERKILECIWNRGGEVHVHLISSKTGFSSDYSLFLCRSLEKAGHLEFINPNLCKALSNILSDNEDDQSEEDENIEEAEKDQEAMSGPEVQPVDYGAGKKQEEEIDKKLEELLSNEDEDEADFSSPADDENAAQETEENVSGNDILSIIEHNEEGIEEFGEI